MKARYWFGLSLVALAGAGAGYCAIQPTFHPATEEQLRKTLPPDVLRDKPPDIAAEGRFNQIASLGNGLEQPKLDGQDVMTNREEIHRQNGPLLRMTEALLEQGPLRVTPSSAGTYEGFPQVAALKALVKAFSYEAVYDGENHDGRKCADALIDGLRLSDAAMNTDGRVIDILVAVACKAIAMKVTATSVRKGYLDSEELKRVLAAIPPTTPSNPQLADALRHEWRDAIFAKDTGLLSISNQGRKAVTDGEGHGMVGNFDALETAKGFAGLYFIEISNAMLPWTKQDPGISKYADLAKELPQDPDAEYGDSPDQAKKPSKLAYEVRMNRIPNSLGKNLIAIVANTGFGSLSVSTSTNAELVRTLIAVQLYRNDHDGKAPASLQELVSQHYLPSLPIDRFCEKPLHYDLRPGVIYSVGSNLVDDHAGFDNEAQPNQLDFGYYLIPPKPKVSAVPGGPPGSFLSKPGKK
ncbi:MAG TPA: hypothetical protein VG944_20520 [Fimbriimonas sp.]|nr:hypothetical protein [Fimbriimonas sp.]